MVEALEELLDSVLLIAFLSKVKELLVLLEALELTLEDREKELVEWLQEILQVNRLEASKQI